MGLDPASTVDPDRPLRELGLDSLMAVELRNALAAGLGRSLPATLLFDYPSLDAIANHVIRTLGGAPSPGGPPAPEPAPDDTGRRSVEALTEVEAEAELMRELADIKDRRPRD
jgi:acyl carrier protein